MTNSDVKNAKRASEFSCDSCYYKCCNRADYNRHLTTRKHKIMTNNDAKPIEKQYCCSQCNKSYKHRQGLFTHKKTCKVNDIVDASSNNYMTIISQLLNQNNELKNFILEQASEHKKDTIEIVNKAIESAKSVNNTINGNVTNNNQKFNINVFLNEQCKDAMNLSDFINSIEVSREDLENNAQLGFVGGISKIFLDNLRQLSVNKRPIHCTDLKRETMYIKDDDKWTKETGPAKLNTVIQRISQKSTRTLLDWKKVNPDYNDHDSEFSNRCIVIQRNSMAGHDRETYYPKVIRAIAKEVTI
jgi:hypothetical protein